MASVGLFIKIFKAFMISFQLLEKFKQASWRADHRVSEILLTVTFVGFERHSSQRLVEEEKNVYIF